MAQINPRGDTGLEPLPAGTMHLVVDMQRLFADATDWHVPALHGILPAVVRLAEAHPADTLFARFVTPANAAAASGRWRQFYRRWAGVTGERIDPALLDLVAPLAALADPDAVFDKGTLSAFAAPALLAALDARRVEALVLTGVETDSCILATLLDAVDRGYRVVVPVDAVASASPEAHAATLAHLLPRLAEQVDLTTVDAVLGAWR